MGAVVGLLVTIGLLGAALLGFLLLGQLVRRRGLGRAVGTAFDTYYRPSSHEIDLELERDRQRPDPPTTSQPFD